MNSKNPTPQTWTYETAPNSPHLSGTGITTRQLRRWTEQGKVSHLKLGNRVVFTDEHLRELIERATVRAVR